VLFGFGNVSRGVNGYAGSGNFDPGAEVGKVGFGVVGVGGGHAQNTIAAVQIRDLRFGVVVARGGNDQDTGVLGRGHRVIQGRTGAPAAVDDIGPIGRSVNNTVGTKVHPHNALAIIGRPAAANGHDFATGRSACNTNSVVGDGRGHTSAVGAVASPIHGVVVRGIQILAGKAGDAMYKIPATVVVDLAVAVVIDPGGAVVFGPVGPDGAVDFIGMVPAQVGMVPVDSGIENADDDIGVTQGFGPAADGADVATPEGRVPQVILRTADPRIVGKISAVSFANIDGMNFFHLRQGAVSGQDIVQTHLGGKIDGINAVQDIGGRFVLHPFPELGGHVPTVERFHIVDGILGGQSVEGGDSDLGSPGGFVQRQGHARFHGDQNAVGHLAHHGRILKGPRSGCCRPENKSDQDGKQNLFHDQDPLLNVPGPQARPKRSMHNPVA